MNNNSFMYLFIYTVNLKHDTLTKTYDHTQPISYYSWPI